MQRKYQKIKKQIYFCTARIISHIGYKYIELNNWVKVSIFAAALWIISLFLPWLQSLDGMTHIYAQNLHLNAFSAITWFIWYFIFPFLVFVGFSLISSKRKERLKFFSLVDIPDSIIVFFASWLLFIISIQYYFIVWGLQQLSQNIIYWPWLILSTTSSILFFLWYYLLQSTKRRKTWITLWYEEEISNFKKHHNDVGNMKLPF